MDRKTILALAAMLAGADLTLAARAAPGDEIAAAENLFSREAQTMGSQAAFRRHVAPDAVAFDFNPTTGRPRVVNARDRLAARPDTGKVSKLDWWPSLVGVSRSGDFGYTSGPVRHAEGRYNGYVFTVWRKQADGGWKWYFDGGPQTRTASTESRTAPPALLSMSSAASDPHAARREILGLEAQIARAAVASARTAIADFLATDARLLGSGAQPASNRAAHRVELATRPDRVAFNLLGDAVAPSGDMALTYGEVLTPGPQPKLLAGFARIWQRRADGWRIVYDQTLEPPPAAAAAAPAAQAAPGG